MKRNLFPLICCELCNKKFRRITNTHLFKDHQITLEDYQLLFPDSPIDAPGLAKRRVQHLRNKTYIEVYGEEKARGLIEKRSIDAINQMDDEEQIIIRKEKCGYKISQEQRDKLREMHTIHGGSNYRDRALEFYGLECQRCGYSSENESDFIVHHKDFSNIYSELGNHDIDNLQVLCRSCHAKLHNEISRMKGKFTGIDNVEKGIHYIFKGLKQEFNLDLSDENFKDTPKRVARAYYEIFSGLKNTEKQIENILATSFPSEGYRAIIFCPDVITYSMCPHHLLPVEYKISIGYIPSESGRVLGASKIPRIVEILSKRPVLQEALTQDIVRAFKRIDPIGVACVVSGVHYCMKMRGVKKQTSFETSAMDGVFMNDPSARKEFFDLLLLSRK